MLGKQDIHSQGQISRILDTTYEHLDGNLKRQEVQALKEKSRSSAGDWPMLEAALYEWQQHMQTINATVTGDVLKRKAEELWNALPQFKDQEMLKWSNGWLDGFKKRYKIKQYVHHGEAGSAQTSDPQKIAQMEAVRQLCTEYELRDVFNMDETGLNWRRTPDRTLATAATAGTKRSKDRITVALTVNADGSEKLDPWVIGRSKNPRCFKRIQRNELRMAYRFNKAKWMTGIIFEEYLRWLNRKMRGQRRKVLLLIDNFSAHELGVQLVGGEEGLSHVRIAWLPKNTTSVWQPLDQGVIANFKLHYRRNWVKYMIKEHEAGRDPQKTTNLLKTIMWTRVAWESMVTSQTIYNCWVKSTCIKKEEEDTAEDSSTEDVARLET
jgi:hypothetical protein